MKIVMALFCATLLTAFIGYDNAPAPKKSVHEIQRQIDSFNTETKVNQELFKLKIKQITNPN